MAVGDKIRIYTKEETLEGILMPSPEILRKDIVVLKLDNGYNIGVEKKKIQKAVTIERYKKKKRKALKIKFNKSLPTVSILSTGGTISSKIDYRTGGVYAHYTAEDFIEMCPEILNIANIKARKIMSVMSEDINPKLWITMAKEIVKELKKSHGVVVTHGTDTLHYSTAALSFLIKNLNKPVIFTGAQRSIDRGSSDAFMNLICAVAAAARFDGAEVMSCMHGTINDDYCLLIRGTKVRKMHTSRRDAFRSINEKPIAKVFTDGRLEILNKNYSKRNEQKAEINTKINEKVALIQVYPNINPGLIDYLIKKRYRGIVIAATALGHVPTSGKNSIIEALKRAIAKKIAVVITSQTIYGTVHPYVYTNLRKLSIKLGCIFAEMLPEVAYVKLIHVLGQTSNMAEIKRMMHANIAGELIKSEPADAFLF